MGTPVVLLQQPQPCQDVPAPRESQAGPCPPILSLHAPGRAAWTHVWAHTAHDWAGPREERPCLPPPAARVPKSSVHRNFLVIGACWGWKPSAQGGWGCCVQHEDLSEFGCSLGISWKRGAIQKCCSGIPCWLLKSLLLGRRENLSLTDLEVSNSSPRL